MLGTRAAITNRWRLIAYRCTRNLVKRNVVSSLGLPVRAYPSVSEIKVSRYLS